MFRLYLVATFFAVLGVSFADAQSVIREEFDDQSVADGQPLAWFADSGSFSLLNGEVQITSTGGNPAILAVDDVNEQGWSMRAQVRRQQGSLTGLGVLFDGGNAWALLNSLSELRVGQFEQEFAILPLGLDPNVQDVVFQLDTFDNELRAWAWLPGEEPTTEEPMLSAPIATVWPNQRPVIWALDFNNVSGGNAASTFRWFELSTQHIPVVIPEPATWVLGLLCLAGGLVLCRRGPSSGRR